MQIANLAYHGVRVDLAHVVAPVVLLGLADVQQPCVGVVVGDTVPRDTGDHVPMYRQYHLPVYVDPGDLQMNHKLELSIHRPTDDHDGRQLAV